MISQGAIEPRLSTTGETLLMLAAAVAVNYEGGEQGRALGQTFDAYVRCRIWLLCIMSMA